MQIQQQVHTSLQPERAAQLKEGDVYRATIKERRGQDEALLTVRGREVVAKFEGGLPSGERTTIQVIEPQSDVIRVKVLSAGGSQTRASEQGSVGRQQEVTQTLRQLGVQQPTAELRQAAGILMDKGVPLSKEAVQELHRFLNEGKAEQRLQTVQSLANKRLEVTSTHLRSVHEALHGRPLNHVLTDLAKQIDQNFKPQPAERERLDRAQVSMEREPSLVRAAERLQQLANHPQVDQEVSRLIERTMSESKHLDKVAAERIIQALQIERANSSGHERQVIQEIRQTIQREGFTQPVREQIEALLRQNGLRTEVVEQIERSMQLQQVARERILHALARIEQSLPTATTAGTQNQQASLADAVQQAEMTLQREASLERAIHQVQKAISGQPGLSEGMTVQFNRAIEAAKGYQEQGRELKARQELAAIVSQIKEVATVDRQPKPIAASTYIQNEQFQTSVEMASKSIAVTTVTEKLAQMTADFKSLQRDITRNLSLVNRQIEQFRNQAQQQAKPLLETTIKKLDNAILRSEMMQVADMKTERQLMQASSQLHEAKKLLAKGQHHDANRIVREVQQLVERLTFQPSETKIKHYTTASERALRDAQLPSQSFSQQLNETARGPIQEGSPRAMFEVIRSLGLNRDSEIAQQLASGREQQQDTNQRNLKATLLQLARGEEEGTRVQQLASQALNNVTGQQLLSRSDQQGNIQSMFFQLPFLLEEKVENLQVFVNSRNEGQQVDWENCNLYFLMETPKMGEVGIMVSVAERQLSVTLKNDKADFQARMEPLVEMAIEKLAEIGYSIKGINYAHLTNKDEKIEEPETKPVFTEKGFDFKI